MEICFYDVASRFGAFTDVWLMYFVMKLQWDSVFDRFWSRFWHPRYISTCRVPQTSPDDNKNPTRRLARPPDAVGSEQLAEAMGALRSTFKRVVCLVFNINYTALSLVKVVLFMLRKRNTAYSKNVFTEPAFYNSTVSIRPWTA